MILGLQVCVHEVVHGGGDQQRSAAGEHRPRHDLIRDPERELGEAVRGRRHDGNQFTPLGQRDMALSRTLGVEPVGGDRVVRQGFESERRHEARCLGRHHHPHLRASVGQEPNDLDRLVPGDPTADPDDDAASLQAPLRHTGVLRRSCSAAIIARISRAVSSTSRLQTTCS